MECWVVPAKKGCYRAPACEPIQIIFNVNLIQFPSSQNQQNMPKTTNFWISFPCLKGNMHCRYYLKIAFFDRIIKPRRVMLARIGLWSTIWPVALRMLWIVRLLSFAPRFATTAFINLDAPKIIAVVEKIPLKYRKRVGIVFIIYKICIYKCV